MQHTIISVALMPAAWWHECVCPRSIRGGQRPCNGLVLRTQAYTKCLNILLL